MTTKPFQEEFRVRGMDDKQSMKHDDVQSTEMEMQPLQHNSHSKMSKENSNLLDWYYCEECLNKNSCDENVEDEDLRLYEEMHKTFKIILKLFNDHVKGLQTNIDDLRCIADKLDSFHKKATIAKITGGSVSVAGGVVTIIGLILTPFTLGASLVVTGVGLGVAMAGGMTNASATISDTVNNSVDRKKVEEIIESFQKNINVFVEPLENVRNIRNKIELSNTCKLEDLMNKWNKAQLGARAGKMFTSFADIARLAVLANLSGGVAKAIRVAGAATGVLSGLFLALDIFFIVKDSIDLHKGAKNEYATKIREVADELQCALQELNEFCVKLQTIQNL